MKFEGYIEIRPGLWYCEKDGTPWTNKKQIHLNNGKGFKTVFIDKLETFKCKGNGGYYAVYVDEKNEMINFHRLVYEYFIGSIPKDKVVDHIDNNIKNNLYTNLQLLSPRENSFKRKPNKNNMLKCPGVREKKYKSGIKYEARISINQKYVYLGLFNSKEEASRVYLECRKKHYGEDSIKYYNVTP